MLQPPHQEADSLPVPLPSGSAASPTLSSWIRGSALVLLETLQTKQASQKF